MLSKIDPDEAHADWVAATALELIHLIDQVTDHAIDLLDHCFRENLCFRANLNSRDRPSSDEHSFLCHRDHCGNEFSECAITTPGWLACHDVARVHDALMMLHALDELC